MRYLDTITNRYLGDIGMVTCACQCGEPLLAEDALWVNNQPYKNKSHYRMERELQASIGLDNFIYEPKATNYDWEETFYESLGGEL